MKAVLKFDLPDEREDFEMALAAGKMHSALWDFSQDVLRKLDKYGFHPSGRELTLEEHAIVSFIREEFYRVLNDNQVELL